MKIFFNLLPFNMYFMYSIFSGVPVGKNKQKIDFHSFYHDLFPERWENLKKALLKEPVKSAYMKGLLKPYYLDEASVMAAMALDVQQGDTVLDLCAAPGGKTLILACQMGTSGSLTSNDRSSLRRNRLKRVISEHIPDSIAEHITVTGHDASRWSLHENGIYDKILLDAPCSSERHVITSPEHLNKWSPARTKHLAIQAYSMLVSALEAVKINGIIVYSTCALSPFENDGVLEKLSRKRKGRFSILHPEFPFGEPTTYGWQILPDTEEGHGPMYIAKIKRIM